MANQSLSAVMAEIKANPSKFYVYVLSRPDGTPFYVGMGQGRRLLGHKDEACRGVKSRKANIIRKIHAQGGEIYYRIDGWFDTRADAGVRECELIASLGRLDLATGSLANATSGGDGASGFSRETLEKLSRVVKAARNLPASREKSRIASTAMWKVDGFRDRAVRSVRDSWKDPTHKQMRVAAMTASLAAPDVKEKLSAASLSLWRSEEHRGKISAALTARWKTPEFRQSMVGIQHSWQSVPEKAAKCAAAISRSQKKRLADPVVRANLSAKAKARWLDPVLREKMLTTKAAALVLKKKNKSHDDKR